jgi:hypothetical protein
MATRLNNALRNVASSAIGTAFNGGSAQVRTGAQPAAGGAATGTLLVTIPLPTPAFTSFDGVLTKAGTWAAEGVATGNAGYVRLISPGGGFLDLAVGAEVTLTPNNEVQVGGMVTVATASITMPAE